MRLSYTDINSFIANAKGIFESVQVKLYGLQLELKECVDYIYNLNGNIVDEYNRELTLDEFLEDVNLK